MLFAGERIPDLFLQAKGRCIFHVVIKKRLSLIFIRKQKSTVDLFFGDFFKLTEHTVFLSQEKVQIPCLLFICKSNVMFKISPEAANGIQRVYTTNRLLFPKCDIQGVDHKARTDARHTLRIFFAFKAQLNKADLVLFFLGHGIAIVVFHLLYWIGAELTLCQPRQDRKLRRDLDCMRSEVQIAKFTLFNQFLVYFFFFVDLEIVGDIDRIHPVMERLIFFNCLELVKFRLVRVRKNDLIHVDLRKAGGFEDLLLGDSEKDIVKLDIAFKNFDILYKSAVGDFQFSI